MPISPELSRLPRIANSFRRAGLLGELLTDMVRGAQDRSLMRDSIRLLEYLEKNTPVILWGKENLSKLQGGVIVFNHPNIEVLLPAMLKLFVETYSQGEQIRLAMGSEIPMATKNFNEKISLPGSVELISRFHKLYSENIISVPTAESRKDYFSGRVVALRKIAREVKGGALIFISPEGHVELNNVVSPTDSYHDGAGSITVLAARLNKPTIPVSIWQTDSDIQVVVGEPFFMDVDDPELAAAKSMFMISRNLPVELRGPFQNI